MSQGGRDKMGRFASLKTNTTTQKGRNRLALPKENGRQKKTKEGKERSKLLAYLQYIKDENPSPIILGKNMYYSQKKVDEISKSIETECKQLSEFAGKLAARTDKLVDAIDKLDDEKLKLKRQRNLWVGIAGGLSIYVLISLYMQGLINMW